MLHTADDVLETFFFRDFVKRAKVRIIVAININYYKLIIPIKTFIYQQLIRVIFFIVQLQTTLITQKQLHNETNNFFIISYQVISHF